MASATQVEAVARALCRVAVLQRYQQGDATPDIRSTVDKTWHYWKIEAEAAIEAYEKSKGQ